MSYQTGTALHIDDLLLKLSVFAQANGWTENKAVAGSGDGASSELYLSKGVSFFAFAAILTGGTNVYHGVSQAIDHPQLRLYGATGFNGAFAVNAQPGTTSTYVETNWLLPNMTAYHFFTDPTKTYLHVVVETTANEFRHFGIGLLDKVGVYTGGEYTYGTRWSQAVSFIDVPGVGQGQHGSPWTTGGPANASPFVRANVDGSEWKIANGSSGTINWFAPLAHNFQGDVLGNFLSFSTTNVPIATPNRFNSTVVLFPLPCYIVRSATQRAPIGKPFDVRACNIQNISPSSLLTFGGDDWLIFPNVEKKDPLIRDDLPNSGWTAFAYLKVP